jgi:hypothetical protein
MKQSFLFPLQSLNKRHYSTNSLQWTSLQIRKSFLEYFQKNHHVILPSSPLIPDNDPSLLFTAAGRIKKKFHSNVCVFFHSILIFTQEWSSLKIFFLVSKNLIIRKLQQSRNVCELVSHSSFSLSISEQVNISLCVCFQKISFDCYNVNLQEESITILRMWVTRVAISHSLKCWETFHLETTGKLKPLN